MSLKSEVKYLPGTGGNQENIYDNIRIQDDSTSIDNNTKIPDAPKSTIHVEPNDNKKKKIKMHWIFIIIMCILILISTAISIAALSIASNLNSKI